MHYQRGLLFTDTDVKRECFTHTNILSNKERPQFRRKTYLSL
jgi:hypothetical protein